jgi:5-formyltetrahydrofolate cyclo-ligase
MSTTTATSSDFSRTAPPPDLARWRQAVRDQLVARRLAVPESARADWDLSISVQLLHAMPLDEGTIVGFCWPHRGEYDARRLLRGLRARGLQCALPVVLQRAAPMIFRLWRPGVAMHRGAMGIPHPLDTPTVEPQILLVPLVGFGNAGDRLGYGGGYFDRTLASRVPRPLSIGVGYELARIDSTFPQEHDIPMDAIATEAGLRWRDGNVLRIVTAREMREKLTSLRAQRSALSSP